MKLHQFIAELRLFDMYQSPAYKRPIPKHKGAHSRPHMRAYSWSDQQFDSIYVGISGFSERFGPRVAIAISNATYLVDYLEYEFGYQEGGVPCSVICDSIIAELERYTRTYLEKIMGVAFPKEVHDRVPNLCSRLWTELDCIPFALDQHRKSRQQTDQGNVATFRGWNEKSLDEQADSMVRKCISFFGAGNIPHLDIGIGGLVEIDSAFHMHITSARDFQNSVTPQTWSLAQYYAADLKERGVKIAIFSATPQGEAIANTRNALLRLLHCLGTDIRWYVPDPAPLVSRIVGKIQNILKGISSPEEHLTMDEELQLLNWVYKNAKHHWLCYNGPLRRAQEGGVDIVIIDDPFLSSLALISKQHNPNRPVIFHNRMNIHIDPAASAGDARTEVFDFIWRTLQHVDILACQAPSTLESRLIPESKVGYTLATVDKFDGRNKDMKDLDLAFYGRQFNASYCNSGTKTINYPDDEYIFVQLSHTPSFQQASTVLEAYKEFCNLMKTSSLAPRLPKLLFCDRQTHGDANEEFYESVASHIMLKMNDLGALISVKQVRPPDQIWNTLLSKAEVVILLSDTEGFEERFLEAVQKGKPVIRTETLGPYRSLVEDDKNVFTVEIADANSMAEHLFKICVDGQLQQQVKLSAPNKTWDEVTTVGNAENWLFLASKLTKGENIEPNGEYIYHLAQRGSVETHI